mmetsp:Transcript_2558/g.8433  ORF Transcript_2558/g.8433 Transcript_2558/m.8433 type:complete len:85 (-) Transcript_2558:475-729(-)
MIECFSLSGEGSNIATFVAELERGRQMSSCKEMQTVCAGSTGYGQGGESARSSGLKFSFASPFTQESQDWRIDVQISVRSEVDM